VRLSTSLINAIQSSVNGFEGVPEASASKEGTVLWVPRIHRTHRALARVVAYCRAQAFHVPNLSGTLDGYARESGSKRLRWKRHQITSAAYLREYKLVMLGSPRKRCLEFVRLRWHVERAAESVLQRKTKGAQLVVAVTRGSMILGLRTFIVDISSVPPIFAACHAAKDFRELGHPS